MNGGVEGMTEKWGLTAVVLVEQSYSISTQLFSSWLRDNVIGFWVELGLSVLYWLIKKVRRDGGCMYGR